MEGRSNRDRRAESRQATDVLDRLGGRLQYLARSIDACVCEPCHRRHARLLSKPTAQCPSRRVCPRRERAKVERKCKVFEHPIAKGAELVAARVWHEPFDELRLPSSTLWRSHEAAGSCVGSRGAEVAPDDVEGRSSRTPAAARANAAVQIDTNRAPRACAARMASSTAAETVASTSSYPGMISVSARLSPSRPAGVLTVNPEPGSDADRTSAQTVRR